MNIAGVSGVLTLYGPKWVCHRPSLCVLPGSTWLRLQGVLHGHCPKWALSFVHFPGSKPLRFWVFHKGTDWLGMCFGPFLGPSSSDDRVLAEHSVLGGPCVLLT